MITLRHLEIYSFYGEDGDGFIRCANANEKAVMSDKDWSLIENLTQDIFLTKKGLSSKEFSDALQKRLLENCDGSETIKQLRKVADNRARK